GPWPAGPGCRRREPRSRSRPPPDQRRVLRRSFLFGTGTARRYPFGIRRLPIRCDGDRFLPHPGHDIGDAPPAWLGAGVGWLVRVARDHDGIRIRRRPFRDWEPGGTEQAL
ncbi:MAG: hypothetical protein AVDCRST_MAG73-3058, partial [uncultured Thermomicrobiales bacterium]